MLIILKSQEKRFRVLRHLFLFVGMVLLFSWVVNSGEADERTFFNSLILVSLHALFFFGYAYLVVYLLIPRYLLKGMVVHFLVSFLVSGILISLVKFTFSDLVFYQALTPEGGGLPATVTLRTLLINTKDMSFIVVIFAILKYARDHYILQSTIRELQQRSMEAEISLLEHQMDPHVIFNNFNNLYSISLYRPALLPQTVKKMKSVLHYLFMDSKLEKVPLSQEIAMLQNYIGLESLRFGERLNVSFTMEGEAGDLEISPLILYPFVENCFIHGAGDDPHRSWIKVELEVKEGRLRFFAANSVAGDGRREGKGGEGSRENSIRRLELQYPSRHRLTIREREDSHVVELNIALQS